MITIDNVKLESCIMNAAGLGTVTHENIKLLEQTKVGAIVSKTCTYERRNGHLDPTSYFDDMGSINSVGLRNQGYKYYLNYKPILKPYILSVAPDKRIFEDEEIYNVADLIELNLSCPNMQYNSTYRESLRKITECCNKRFGIKLPPFIETKDIEIMSDTIKEFENISFITCCNTLKNGLILDDFGNSTISQVLGGIGGKYLKPIALSNVYRFNKIVNIPIIGCGGIECGKDVMDYLKCGAKAVQVGTYFFNHGPWVFDKIYDEIKLNL